MGIGIRMPAQKSHTYTGVLAGHGTLFVTMPHLIYFSLFPALPSELLSHANVRYLEFQRLLTWMDAGACAHMECHIATSSNLEASPGIPRRPVTG
jgi:hypothetical protein